MIINETITSAQNPRIKHLLALQQKSSLRRSEQLFVVEGRRELDHCLQAGYEVDTIFMCPELAREAPPLTSHFAPLTSHVSPQVYERIAYRGTTEGIEAIVDGRMDMTVMYTNCSGPGVDMACKILQGEEVPSDITIDPFIVDASNAEEYYNEGTYSPDPMELSASTYTVTW